jgi:hypothetical protein
MSRDASGSVTDTLVGCLTDTDVSPDLFIQGFS